MCSPSYLLLESSSPPFALERHVTAKTYVLGKSTDSLFANPRESQRICHKSPTVNGRCLPPTTHLMGVCSLVLSKTTSQQTYPLAKLPTEHVSAGHTQHDICRARAIMPVPSFLCHRARRIKPMPSRPCNRSLPNPSCLCHHACANVPVPKPSCLCHFAHAIVPVPSCLCPSHRASACAIVSVPLFPCHRARAIVPVSTCLCQTLQPRD